jgi:hypothetical protein
VAAVTRADAERECARLAAEHPDRGTHQWRPREEADGQWSVVKIALPPIDPDGQTELRAEEKPPTPDDPRSAHERNVGGPNIGPIL